MKIEITKGEIKSSKGGNSYLFLSFKNNGHESFGAVWEETDIKAYSGPGEYEAIIEEQTGKDGKKYNIATELKLISLAPTTPAGLPISSLDPNSLIRERASTARTAVMVAKDLAIARGESNVTTVCELALALFKQMQALSTGKPGCGEQSLK